MGRAYFLRILWLGLLIGVAIKAESSDDCPRDPKQLSFEEFKIKFNKHYATTADWDWRRHIFEARVCEINAHNILYEQGKVSFTMGVNNFTDWTSEELKALSGLRPNTPSFLSAIDNTDVTFVPDPETRIVPALDWRIRGAVTPVKSDFGCAQYNQAPIAAIEALYYARTGKLESLSAQQVLDCYQFGCRDGTPYSVYDYAQFNGLLLEKDYPPYTGVRELCRINPLKNSTFMIRGRGYVGHATANVLKALIEKGPLSVTVTSDFVTNYKGGIIPNTETCSNVKTSHQATIVGYGSENNVAYYVLKTSYGKVYGEEGYFRMVQALDVCKFTNIRYPIY